MILMQVRTIVNNCVGDGRFLHRRNLKHPDLENAAAQDRVLERGMDAGATVWSAFAPFLGLSDFPEYLYNLFGLGWAIATPEAEAYGEGLKLAAMSGSEEVGSTVKVGYARAMWAPLAPLVALGLAMVLGANPGVVVLVLLVVLVVLGVAMITFLGPTVTVSSGRLTVGNGERRGRGPGGSVDLSRLTRARSVGYRGGLVTERGPALFRNQLLLEDADSGAAMFGAWGWTPKEPLQALLRRGISDGHARMDPLTFLRLGFKSVQGTRISPLRRFL